MTERNDIEALAEDLEVRMGETLGLTRGDFAARVARAGRLLPRAVRRDAKELGAALELAAHPKLRRRVDEEATQAAYQRVRAHLDTVDPKARRTNFVLGILAGLAFNILLAVGLLLAFLHWRGML